MQWHLCTDCDMTVPWLCSDYTDMTSLSPEFSQTLLGHLFLLHCYTTDSDFCPVILRGLGLCEAWGFLQKQAADVVAHLLVFKPPEADLSSDVEPMRALFGNPTPIQETRHENLKAVWLKVVGGRFLTMCTGMYIDMYICQNPLAAHR